jgi:hypothetical protein
MKNFQPVVIFFLDSRNSFIRLRYGSIIFWGGVASEDPDGERGSMFVEREAAYFKELLRNLPGGHEKKCAKSHSE